MITKVTIRRLAGDEEGDWLVTETGNGMEKEGMESDGLEEDGMERDGN